MVGAKLASYNKDELFKVGSMFFYIEKQVNIKILLRITLVLSLALSFFLMAPRFSLASHDATYQFKDKWPASAFSFRNAQSVVISSQGNIFVSDALNYRIYKFDSSGSLIAQWGSKGSGDGQFSIGCQEGSHECLPGLSIATDASENIYVADNGNNRIQKFSPTGSFIGKWGTKGTGDGQFEQPSGIAVDPTGKVYVIDFYNYRIQKFSPTGAFVTKFGGWGYGAGYFKSPIAIAADSLGNIYVSDRTKGNVQKFNSSGTHLANLGQPGPGNFDGDFDWPHGITFDASDNVYIADSSLDRIQKFNPEGNFLATLGWGQTGYPEGLAMDADGNIFAASGGVSKFNFTNHFLGSWGSPAEAWGPADIAIDALGNRYVTDALNHRILKYNSAGALIDQWGSEGTGDGEFNSPQGIAVDASGFVYVVDKGNHRVQKFNSAGEFQIKWGGQGSTDVQLSNPRGISVDSLGSVYVADSGNNYVKNFDADGVFIKKFGTGYGTSAGKMYMPSDVVVDPSGNVYVAEEGNDRVQKFDSDGTSQGAWGSWGTAAGQFKDPRGIGLDINGDLIVADYNGSRLQKKSPAGAFQVIVDSGGGMGKVFYPQGLGIGSDGTLFIAEIGRVQQFDSFGISNGAWNSKGIGDDLWRPNGIEVDSSGYSYVADTFNNRIAVLNPSGAYSTSWASYGTGDGQFNYPMDIARGQSGDFYIADTGNNRIQKFSPTGAFITTWGSYGSATGAFNTPTGIALDDSNNVYVVDQKNNRIQKFSPTGAFIRTWGSYGAASTFQPNNGKFYWPTGIAISGSQAYVTDTNNHRIQYFDLDGNYSGKSGVQGIGLGRFSFPAGIEVNNSGAIFVSDKNHAVQMFSGANNFIWGSEGSAPDQLDTPRGMALDNDGSLRVVDSQNDRIQIIGPSGDLTSQLKEDTSGEGKFSVPNDAAIDSAGNIYVADTSNIRIQKFDASGNFLLQWDKGFGGGPLGAPTRIVVDAQDDIYVLQSDKVQKFDANGSFVSYLGSGGTESGEFQNPKGLAVDNEQNVYVLNGSHNQSSIAYHVQKFNSSGNFVLKWGGYDQTDGTFSDPADIAIDAQGNVYVADKRFSFQAGEWPDPVVQKFNSSGQFLSKWNTGSGLGYGVPGALSIDLSDNIHVSMNQYPDSENGTLRGTSGIYTYSPSGSYIMRWGAASSIDDQVKQPRGIAFDASEDAYVADGNSIKIFERLPDTTVPTVNFGSTAIAAGNYLRGTVAFPATATDAGVGISTVSLYDGSTSRGSDTASPYSISLKTALLTNGAHALKFKATDHAGNFAYSLTRSYKIDNYKPRTYAPTAVTIKRGSYGKLYYKVTDPYSPTATVKILIKNSAGKLMQTITLGPKKTGSLLYRSYKASLAVGTYYFYINATDLAGNTQYNIAKNKLVIN